MREVPLQRASFDDALAGREARQQAGISDESALPLTLPLSLLPLLPPLSLSLSLESVARDTPCGGLSSLQGDAQHGRTCSRIGMHTIQCKHKPWTRTRSTTASERPQQSGARHTPPTHRPLDGGPGWRGGTLQPGCVILSQNVFPN